MKSNNRNGFEILKKYINIRNSFTFILVQNYGYAYNKMSKDISLTDDIKNFIETLPLSVQQGLALEIKALYHARWRTITAFRPLLDQFLAQKQYSDEMDPSGVILTKMELALEKAIDRMQNVKPDYIKKWLQASWAGAVSQDYEDISKREGYDNNTAARRWQSRAIPKVFADSESSEDDTISLIDENSSPNIIVEEKYAVTAKDCIRDALDDAELMQEQELVRYIMDLLKKIKNKKNVRINPNNRHIIKFQELLCSTPIEEVLR